MWVWLKSLPEKLKWDNLKNNLGTLMFVAIIGFILFSFSIPKVLNSSSGSQPGAMLAGQSAEYDVASMKMASGRGVSMPVPASAPMSAEMAESSNASPPINMLMASNATVLYKPQIIKTANLTVRVDNILTTMKSLEASTAQFDGVVTNQNVTVSGVNDSFRQGSLTIRIPQERLDKFLNEMVSLGTILNQTISGEDVGMEMVDTQARVKNLRAEESSLQTLMGHSGKIPDILQVERELSRVRGEIEQNQGRLNYLRQQVAYSTVSIALTEQMIATPTQGKPGLVNVFINAIQSALGSLYDLCIQIIELIVWVCLGLLPRLLLLGIVILLIWRLFAICRNKFRKK